MIYYVGPGIPETIKSVTNAKLIRATVLHKYAWYQ